MLLILILAVMISVLIPVFNYDVSTLVSQLHTQLELCDIPFEMICYDDGSDADFISKNNGVTNLSHTTYIIGKDNLGRTKARQYLAEKATYDWLLFIDADVIPKHSDFIASYLQYLNTDLQAVYGGFAYYEDLPNPKYMLRWKYGKTHEQVVAKKRNKRPYKVIISANFIIKKKLFCEFNSKIKQKGYGYDNYFGALLKERKAKVLHIDNAVYHLGIESSDLYLRKKEQAAETLLRLYKNHKINSHQNDLLRLFIKLKKFKLENLVSLLFRCFKAHIKKNLLGKNPSMLLLQFYRIGYLCYLDRNSL